MAWQVSITTISLTSAWHTATELPTYFIDVTPFVPLLTDNSPHNFTLDVVSAETNHSINANWYVSGKILTQHLMVHSHEYFVKDSCKWFLIPARSQRRVTWLSTLRVITPTLVYPGLWLHSEPSTLQWLQRAVYISSRTFWVEVVNTLTLSGPRICSFQTSKRIRTMV